MGKNDWPRFTEEEPEIYETEELGKLFAACDAEERLWYEFFLMTGEREQEVMFTYWGDVNFAASTVRVTHKPDTGWTPKAYKARPQRPQNLDMSSAPVTGFATAPTRHGGNSKSPARAASVVSGCPQ